MSDEHRPEVEAMLEELLARNGVLETMQAQLILMLAGLTDDPATSVRLTMADVQTNLRRSVARAEAAGDVVEARIARRAVEYAADLTKQLVATRRHAGRPTTQ